MLYTYNFYFYIYLCITEIKYMEKDKAGKTIRKFLREWYNFNKGFSGKYSLRRWYLSTSRRWEISYENIWGESIPWRENSKWVSLKVETHLTFSRANEAQLQWSRRGNRMWGQGSLENIIWFITKQNLFGWSVEKAEEKWVWKQRDRNDGGLWVHFVDKVGQAFLIGKMWK